MKKGHIYMGELLDVRFLFDPTHGLTVLPMNISYCCIQAGLVRLLQNFFENLACGCFFF